MGVFIYCDMVSDIWKHNLRLENLWHISFFLPLFLEGQLSVTGESMCTKYIVGSHMTGLSHNMF